MLFRLVRPNINLFALQSTQTPLKITPHANLQWEICCHRMDRMRIATTEFPWSLLHFYRKNCIRNIIETHQKSWEEKDNMQLNVCSTGEETYKGGLSDFAQERDLQDVWDDKLVSVEGGRRHVGERDRKHSSHIHEQLWRLSPGPLLQEALHQQRQVGQTTTHTSLNYRRNVLQQPIIPGQSGWNSEWLFHPGHRGGCSEWGSSQPVTQTRCYQFVWHGQRRSCV